RTMLDHVVWSFGMELTPLALDLAWKLISGVGDLLCARQWRCGGCSASPRWGSARSSSSLVAMPDHDLRRTPTQRGMEVHILDSVVAFGTVSTNRIHLEGAAEALARADCDWFAWLITLRHGDGAGPSTGTARGSPRRGSESGCGARGWRRVIAPSARPTSMSS